MTAPTRAGRQSRIVALLSSNPVRSQTELAALLAEADAKDRERAQGKAKGALHGIPIALKDNINEMIRNLKDTTLKNSEQDWLKTNLAKFTRMLQGQRDLSSVGRLLLCLGNEHGLDLKAILRRYPGEPARIRDALAQFFVSQQTIGNKCIVLR